MQISSNHSGFNFNSVYKSVVTRQVISPASAAITTPCFADDPDFSGKLAAKDQRETFSLMAAQKAAERTVNHLESLPEL